MFERTGNLTRLFWKIHYGNRKWNRVMFDFPRCQDLHVTDTYNGKTYHEDVAQAFLETL